jgi:hypothetical protein
VKTTPLIPNLPGCATELVKKSRFIYLIIIFDLCRHGDLYSMHVFVRFVSMVTVCCCSGANALRTRSPGKSVKHGSSVLFTVYIFLGAFAYFQTLSVSQSIFQKVGNCHKFRKLLKVAGKYRFLPESFSFWRKGSPESFRGSMCSMIMYVQ